MIDGLPPGPRAPLPLQTLAMLTRQRPYLERQRRRYGGMFTVKLLGFGRMVVLSEPELIKHTFKADPKTLHAGTRSPLRRVLGDHSLLGIDEEQHLEQRRILLPPFKGQRMKAYEPLIERVAVEEIDRLPEGVEFPTSRAFQRITLRAILGAVFGATGTTAAELEQLVPALTELGQQVSRYPQLHHDLGPWSPWGRFLRLRAATDAVLDRLIETGRRDPGLAERADVLALMLLATHTDGSSLTNAEIRDQLVTMLAAGHETTAHTLSWAVERLRRNPAALARLAAGDKAYRDATIREVQRTRPVISFAGRFTIEPFEVGGYRLPRDILIGLSAGLTHYDPALFPQPDRFLPERFLDKQPGTYSWIPFGGGIRRCIGATFAHMELDVVLRVLLERVELLPTSDPDEPWRFKGVAWAPARGGRAEIRRRRSAEPRERLVERAAELRAA
ncbi:MAG: cytochrome family [Solirubrobacteraceae bacterium]|jgi:cytochrome P450|nr:cytochrome family [Solirubrobacteraceae bacterium]